MAKATDRTSTVVPDDYNDVVARAVVSGIKLIKSSFDMRPEALDSKKPDRSYAVEVDHVAETYDLDSGRLFGVFRFTATCKVKRTKVLKVQADYLVSYKVSHPCEEVAALLFVERLGPFAAYPYFRALFGILTSHAGLVAPALPILAEAPRRIGRAETLRVRTGSPLLDREDGEREEESE